MLDQTCQNEECEELIEDLRARLDEAEETLRAIRSGEVDALVIAGPQGNQVYTLKGAESTYRVLVEAMNEGALVLTPDGTVMYSNVAFAGMVHVPLEQVIGSRIHRFVQEQDLQTVSELLEHRKGADSKRELVLKNEDTNEPVPAQMSVSILPTEAEGISAVVTDLTEQKRSEAELREYREHLEDLVEERTDQLQAVNGELAAANNGLLYEIEERRRAEEALKESEERFRSMVDAIPQLAWMAEPDGYIFWYNRRWYEYTGTTSQQVEGWGWQTVHDPGILPTVMERWTTAIATGLPFEMEFPLRGADGKYHWFLTRVIPLKDSDGRVVRWFGTNTDISDRKEVENKLAATKDLLQHQVHLLQRALIPARPAVIEGYSVASAYIPGHAGTEIGGDFLDVFRTEDGKVGILIGDVSGKGIESAALAATTRSTVRAFAYDSPTPGDALFHANAVLCAEQTDQMQFVTAFLALLDPATGDVHYSSAGHPPAMVSGSSGETHLLSTRNLPLGVMAGIHYEEGHYSLRRADRLVLYTDGITEARANSDMFGVEGVARVMMSHSLAEPDELVEEMLSAVKSWSHDNLRDDTAVLVIRRDE